MFAMGSHNEIYELIRCELVTEGRQLLWRSRGLRLLHVVIGILVHRRDNYSVNLDYNMIKQTLKLNNIKQLITMEI
ncbi:acyltransferase, partial [Escherichia coli]